MKTILLYRSNCGVQHKFWYERTGVSVVAVAPYYIDTPFLGDWGDWTEDPAAQQELAGSARGKPFLTPAEAALKATP